MLDSTIKMACETPLEAGSTSSSYAEEQKANEIMHSYIRHSMNISKKTPTNKSKKRKRLVLRSALLSKNEIEKD